MRQFQLLLLAIAFGALGLLTACSITKEPGAYGAIAADTATTAIGLTLPGVVELNPLGWAVPVVSIAVVEYAKTLPPEEGVPLIHSMTATKWGVSVSNLFLFLGAAPAGLVAGVGVGYYLWQEGQGEREFWAICAAEKIACKFEPYVPSI